jgi:hypothetical protein
MAAFLFLSGLVARLFLSPACPKASRLMAASLFGSTAVAACELIKGDGSEWLPYCRSFAQKCARAVASKTRSKGYSCSGLWRDTEAL